VEPRTISVLLKDSYLCINNGELVYVALVPCIPANTKIPDARAIQATELVAKLAPNK
jgi:hypothetical protein